MGVLEGFKSKQLEKYISTANATVQIQKRALPFSAVHTIGILLDGKQDHVVQFVQQYQTELEEQGKLVSVFAYLSKASKNPNFPLPYFTKSDTNWFAKPNKKSVVDFIEQPFDLLLNFSSSKILALESICALSKAHFIIGNGTNHFNYYYDFLLKLNNSNAPDSFVENVQHYLNLQQK